MSELKNGVYSRPSPVLASTKLALNDSTTTKKTLVGRAGAGPTPETSFSRTYGYRSPLEPFGRRRESRQLPSTARRLAVSSSRVGTGPRATNAAAARHASNATARRRGRGGRDIRRPAS